MKIKNKRRDPKPLDYHEGMSENQARIILYEFGLQAHFEKFDRWMYGQTCPVIHRWMEGGIKEVGGVYEYDLFRYIRHVKSGEPLIFD